MPILSEHKGVVNWLKSKGHDPQFAQYILNLFKKQTGIEFYEVSYRPNDGKDFQKLVSWYQKQDIVVHKESFKLYVANKLQQKEVDLANYYTSETHKIIVENILMPRNKLYDQFFKGKMAFNKFKTHYQKTNQYLRNN